jgi:hypothetical protein
MFVYERSIIREHYGCYDCRALPGERHGYQCGVHDCSRRPTGDRCTLCARPMHQNMKRDDEGRCGICAQRAGVDLSRAVQSVTS